MITCCGEEMMKADRWYHCRVCHKRLLEHPYGKDQSVIADLVIEYVQEYLPMWKEFQNIFHELWREGYYEDYTADVPEVWNIEEIDK